VNITAADTIRPEPTEELLRTYLPHVEVRSPLPGNAAAWSGARATELLGFTAQHSWRDAE